MYLVTRLFDTNLHRVIYSGHALTDGHVQYIVWQIFRALRYMHAAGVAHRDMKPTNVLLNKDCETALAEPVDVVHRHTASRMQQPKPGVFIFDFHQTISGWVRLRVTGERGSVVRLQHADVLTYPGLGGRSRDWSIDEPVGDQWPFHAVAAALRAHSLLAADPAVDAARIGLTGISWGGYLTCLVSGVDERYRFACPVYGCGFLRGNSA